MNMKQLAAPISRRGVIGILAVAASIGRPESASAICAGVSESGRWRNDNSSGDPAFIDVKMAECGDQVLNGQQTSTRYSLRVWVRQSSGKFYGRPAVTATFRPWNGKKWLYGRVPTGGYVDHVWMSAVNRDGQPYLEVHIKHESLDSKPSSTSRYWFKKS